MNVEKALTFLDDRLLGATSNAVERGNRRYRGAVGATENDLSRAYLSDDWLVGVRLMCKEK